MKYLFSVFAFSAVFASLAHAGPFTNVVANGSSEYSLQIWGNHIYDDSYGYDQQSTNGSFYSGVSGYIQKYDNWQTDEWVYLGDDQWGNQIWEQRFYDHSESGEAWAVANAQFDLTDDTMVATAFGTEFAYSTYSGDGWVNTYTSTKSTIDISFTLADRSDAVISSDGVYGGGSMALYNSNGDLVMDAYTVAGWSSSVMLEAGDYTLQGSNYNSGYANLKLQATAVPEPMSMAVLGMGALALIRRRAKKQQG